MGKTHAQLLSRAATVGRGRWVCWACAREVVEPKIKRRVEYAVHIHRDKTGNHDQSTRDEIGSRYGVYHEACKPRRDDKK